MIRCTRRLAIALLVLLLPPGLAGQAPVDTTFYLHGDGGTNNPPTLFLDQVAPEGSTAKFTDSTGINFAGGNAWKEVGTWTADPAETVGTVVSVTDVHVWLGLKNSDDVGTRFDLRVEVVRNGSDLIGAGEL